jgi:Ran GTPase-activating protein (RanGAP) involved in mRNA processing and transport
MTALGAALKASATVTDLNISKNDLKAKDITGFAEHLKDMGSLSELDISNNGIGSEQTAKIKQICAGKSIKCTL